VTEPSPLLIPRDRVWRLVALFYTDEIAKVEEYAARLRARPALFPLDAAEVARGTREAEDAEATAARLVAGRTKTLAAISRLYRDADKT
jgi:hypothetical protein